MYVGCLLEILNFDSDVTIDTPSWVQILCQDIHIYAWQKKLLLGFEDGNFFIAEQTTECLGFTKINHINNYCYM